MFIVSRYRAPWVAFAFIAVVSIGAFMRFQQSAETDAKNLELDRAEFQLFKKDLAPINLPEKVMNSTVLFELFRCGEDFFSQLSDEQKKAIRPIFNKYFSNRPVR